MAHDYSPCDFIEHDSGTRGLCFSDFDDHIDYLESRDGQGGGYSWEAMVKAVLALRGQTPAGLTFDSESGMFCTLSQDAAPSQAVAAIIRELNTDPALMAQAVDLATEGGYFD